MSKQGSKNTRHKTKQMVRQLRERYKKRPDNIKRGLITCTYNPNRQVVRVKVARGHNSLFLNDGGCWIMRSRAGMLRCADAANDRLRKQLRQHTEIYRQT